MYAKNVVRDPPPKRNPPEEEKFLHKSYQNGEQLGLCHAGQIPHHMVKDPWCDLSQHFKFRAVKRQSFIYCGRTCLIADLGSQAGKLS